MTNSITTIIKEKRSKQPAQVCVLITVYNYELYVKDALDSVREQTLDMLDIVVINDCSTDNSLGKVRKWFNHHGHRFNSFTILHNTINQGVVISRNTALKYIKSEFVFILDADNVLYPRCIKKLLEAIIVSKKEFVYPILERFDNECRLTNLTPWNPARFHYGNAIDAMILVKKSAMESVGGYSSDMEALWEDFELYIKFAKRGFSGAHVPEILARYRVHGNGSRTEKVAGYFETCWEQLREKHKDFFDEITNLKEVSGPIVYPKNKLVPRIRWALRNPLRFSKKHVWKGIPQWSQISWGIHNPRMFCKKYLNRIIPGGYSEKDIHAVRRVYYISNVAEGGSRKYIIDLIQQFQTPYIVFIQIKNKAELDKYKKSFTRNDILIFQYVLFSGITFNDIVSTKKEYGLKLIIPIHDFYFLGKSDEDFLDFNLEIHSRYLNNPTIRRDVLDVLRIADHIIFPSEFVKKIFDSITFFKNAVVSNHVDYTIIDRLNVPPVEKVINIGIINNISTYKGADYYPRLFSIKKYKGYSIHYHVFGTKQPESVDISYHGPYDEGEIFPLLEKNNIHGLVFLNKYGETYSYSLTKGINSGLPILYSMMGAYVERLQGNQKFFPVESIDSIEEGLYGMLRFIIKNAGHEQSNESTALTLEVPSLYRKLFTNDYNKFLSSQYNYYKREYKKLAEMVELYAVYFPQFHALEENNETFYEGYHDMVNLEQAKILDQSLETPLKNYLGYYNLEKDPGIIEKQILLAKAYGLQGFGCYYYWFSHNSITGNHMLMKGVVDKFFQIEMSNFDVFFIYANESWSDNVAFNQIANNYIIRNNYSKEEIVKNFENLIYYFKHKNYKKVNNKPVFFLHHPWEMTMAELDLFYSIGNEMVQEYGFDGLELLVNGMIGNYEGYSNYSHNPSYKKADNFTSIEDGVKYIDYKKYVDRYIPSAQHRFDNIQTVFYNFNNSVRYLNHKNKEILITRTKNNTVEYFKKFLNLQINTYRSQNKKSKMLLLNAWNEWGEQMSIEPSNEKGFQLLDAVKEVIVEQVQRGRDVRRKIIYVGHDAGFYGAQFLSLHIIKELREFFKFDVYLILKSGGSLEEDYKKYATVYNFADPKYTLDEKKRLIQDLCSQGVEHAIVNTALCGDILEMLHDQGIKTLSLIHELPGAIKQYQAEKSLKIIAEKADYVIFPSRFVWDKLKSLVLFSEKKTSVRPQGLFRENNYKNNKKQARKQLRDLLNIPRDSTVILGVGSGDKRKGIDLFIATAKKIKNNNHYFIWTGDIAPEMRSYTAEEAKNSKHIIFIKAAPDISLYFAGADIFLLTSREDPFPSVVIESMSVGVPVIAFKNGGGFIDIVTNKTGVLVPFEDIHAMVQTIQDLSKNSGKLKMMGNESQKLIENNFSFNEYVRHLVTTLGLDKKSDLN